MKYKQIISLAGYGDKSKGHKSNYHHSHGGKGDDGGHKSSGYKGSHHGDHENKHHKVSFLFLVFFFCAFWR